MRTYVRICIYVCTYKYVFICMQTCIRLYMYACMHRHKQSLDIAKYISREKQDAEKDILPFKQ